MALQGIAAVGLAGCAKSGAPEKEMNAKKLQTQESIIAVEPLGMPWRAPNPFLFCVHHDDHYPTGDERMGPTTTLAGRDIGMDFSRKDGWSMYHGRHVPGFPQHPHRGFETVTVVRNGLLDHSDSLGAAARYGGGDVQWLTAGKGVLHAEMFPLLEREKDNPVELFQIWLNLPRADKMVEPAFKMLWSEKIPKHTARDEAGRTTELTVIAGAYGDIKPLTPPTNSYASRKESDVAIWTLKLQPGAKFTLPAAMAGSNRTLLFFRGTGAKVSGRDVPGDRMIELRAELETVIENGATEAEFLMLQGQPIKEPIVSHGPFVMSSREEIYQAFADYQRTQFGGWPWQSDDPVHGREGRFARHADGRTEKPV